MRNSVSLVCILAATACGSGRLSSSGSGGAGAGVAAAGSGAASSNATGVTGASTGTMAAVTGTGATSSASSASGLPIHNEFRNPLNTGPDPFMVVYDGNYYLATTQGDAVRMWKAPSLGELLVAPAVTVWQDTDASRNQQVWAPSFFLINGHWYVYYTADDGVDDHHRLYVVESAGTDPLGPYHFKGQLAPPGSDDWAIDPQLIQQSNGLYIVWSGAGTEGHNLLYVAPLSDPWTISGPRTYLASAGGCPEVREAPSILQHGGTTFLVYSSCDTGKPDYQLYMQSIPMDGDPMNPGSWTQHQGAVFARNDSTGVWGPGSNGFFKSPDGTEDWIVYHGKNTSQYTYDWRTTRAQKITWNADGSPNLGAPVAAGATQPLPSGDPASGAYWINDTGTNNGPGTVMYSANWTAYPNCGAQCFWGDDHGTATAGATATVTFTGTQIALLSARDAGNGMAAISVDGGAETTVDYFAPIRQGEELIYISPHLAFGPHTVTVRATGDKNPSSGGISISFDRAEVYTN